MAGRPSPRLRGMRSVVSGLVVSVALWSPPGMAQSKPDTRDAGIQTIDVTAKPLAGFEKLLPSKTRFGRLEWRGGFVLTSSSANFGGWSGLAVDADGRGFVAVSDAGTWLTGQITYENARPTGIAMARQGPIQALGARSLKKNRDRDAEAVALLAGTTSNGSLLISFEQNQRIGRFDVGTRGVSAPKSYLEMPVEMRRKKRSDGLEAMTVLRGGALKGSVVAIAENVLDKAGRHTGWIWVRGKPQRFHLSDIGGFSITGTASLADGSLVVLERRFRWFEGVRMRLRLIPATDLVPGAALTGETLLEADMTREIDNMEAIAVHDGPRGESILTLMSDDNFNGYLQRTLLLQFSLLPERQSSAR